MRTRNQIIKAWMKALRSGKYKQTRNMLADGDGYCCLGVLCEVAKKDFNLSPVINKETGNTIAFKSGNSRKYDSIPPASLLKYLGLNKKVDSDKLVDVLTVMNDHDKASFKKIATYIEKNILPQ